MATTDPTVTPTDPAPSPTATVTETTTVTSTVTVAPPGPAEVTGSVTVAGPVTVDTGQVDVIVAGLALVVFLLALYVAAHLTRGARRA